MLLHGNNGNANASQILPCTYVACLVITEKTFVYFAVRPGYLYVSHVDTVAWNKGLTAALWERELQNFYNMNLEIK